MKNLEIWNKLKQPPTRALKQIGAGRLKGKTDINPQWRYEAMTNEFGICGVGWKYTIDKLWTEKGAGDVIFAFAQVSVYTRVDECNEQTNVRHVHWSEPIPGIGGSQLVEKESAGLHNNDEAFKMATTDALSVALKMLGVAADIYAGLWDGTKYKDAPKILVAAPQQKTISEEKILSENELIVLLNALEKCTTLSQIKDWASTVPLITDNVQRGIIRKAKDKKKESLGDNK